MITWAFIQHSTVMLSLTGYFFNRFPMIRDTLQTLHHNYNKRRLIFLHLVHDCVGDGHGGRAFPVLLLSIEPWDRLSSSPMPEKSLHEHVKFTISLETFSHFALSNDFIHMVWLYYLTWMGQYKAEQVGRGHPSSSVPHMWWEDLP